MTGAIPKPSRQRMVAITGSNGFVGSILGRNLSKADYKCVGFDCFDGLTYRLLSKRYFQPFSLAEQNCRKAKAAIALWRIQRKILTRLISKNIIRRSDINILDKQERWIERFRGIDSVIHLAGIPHPNYPGARPLDFEIINYWGSVNIFEAAVAAGVKRFIFASSAQVYDVNKYRDWRRFPVQENLADEIQATRTTHPYGSLKWKFEKYLAERSKTEGVVGIALRLEYPGILGGEPSNLWTQTSVENLLDAFDKSLRAEIPCGGYNLNICNAEVSIEEEQLQELLRQHWPDVTNECVGNEALFDLAEARKWIGYEPKAGGSYYRAETVF